MGLKFLFIIYVLFILQFVLLDYILIIFSGGQSIVLFFIRLSLSFSSDLCFDTSFKSVILLQKNIKFQIYTKYLIKLY